MLAMKNKAGVVEGSVPGLADMARLTVEETEDALEILRSPDVYSRTKEFEGRRIEDIDGGWLVLNHAKWREKMNADERRDYLRIKQQEHRAKVNKSVNTRKQTSTPSTHTDKDTNTEEEEIYRSYPRRVKKPAALKAITKALLSIDFDTLLQRTKDYAAARVGQDAAYTPHPATWFNNEQFNDDPSTWHVEIADKRPKERDYKRERLDKEYEEAHSKYGQQGEA